MTPTSTSIDDEWEQERAEEADRIRELEPPPAMTSALFLGWRSPRRGNGNPTRLDNPLWHWLVRTRWSAFRANELLAGPSSINAGPMWCFERFGMSQTTLPDGRLIHIGGEHEDHYDPDFFIYNDVTVVDREGAIAIYGYADTDFPPTDFHSATLVGKAIFVIGRLGYPERREAGSTPVYRLLLDSMSMEAVETQGASPGWIHRHSASFGDDGATITIAAGERWLGPDLAAAENIDSWAFDTRTGEWRRLSHHRGQR